MFFFRLKNLGENEVEENTFVADILIKIKGNNNKY